MFCISLPRGLWLDMMGDTTLHVGLPSLLGFSSGPRFLFSKETQNRNLLLSLLIDLLQLQGASDSLPNNRPNPLRPLHCDEKRSCSWSDGDRKSQSKVSLYFATSMALAMTKSVTYSLAGGTMATKCIGEMEPRF